MVSDTSTDICAEEKERTKRQPADSSGNGPIMQSRHSFTPESRHKRQRKEDY